MQLSRLDLPDLPLERWEHAHSPTFAHVLKGAYAHLALGQFDDAERLVEPYQTWPMSVGQRLRQMFILGAAAHRREDFQQSIAYLEQAVDLSLVLDGRAEYAQLALLSAEAHHNLQAFGTAATIAQNGLNAWLDLKKSDDPVDVNVEIDLRSRCSIELFLGGHYQDALKQCYLAQTLTRAQPASRAMALRSASLDWTIALLHRWRGQYKLAQQHVLLALSIYERLGSPAELARLQIVAADITLDMMVPLGSGIMYHYREDLLQQSHVYVSRALKALSSDPAALCMARLAQARLQRALGVNADGFVQLQSLSHIAKQLHDLPLLGQIYTALGDEFGAAGKAERESQLNCYRRAVGVVESSQAPAYMVWGLRGLLQKEEFEESLA